MWQHLPTECHLEDHLDEPVCVLQIEMCLLQTHALSALLAHIFILTLFAVLVNL